MRSLWCGRRLDYESSSWKLLDSHSGVALATPTPSHPLNLDDRCTLPCRIWLPGFAINTVFYTTILWLLCVAPFQIRRYWRRKRGLCPACAYPIGSSDVCTECGTPLPSPLSGTVREGVELQIQVQCTNDPEVYPPPRPLPAPEREGET